eukprot:3486206-Amphidinium_carterae.1
MKLFGADGLPNFGTRSHVRTPPEVNETSYTPQSNTSSLHLPFKCTVGNGGNPVQSGGSVGDGDPKSSRPQSSV